MGRTLLDDRDRCRALDPRSMVDLVVQLGETLREGYRIGKEVSLPEAPEVEQVVVLGMGGSGIGGDLLRGLLYDRADIPVAVVKDYTVPRWVGPRTLVFACSYSGNTEETLAAYEAAGQAGAVRVAITSGGVLYERARSEGVPVVRVPSGFPPRAALGYLFAPLLAVLERWGVIPQQEAAVAEVASVLAALAREWGPDRPEAENPAKQLARTLAGRIPVIYALSRFTEPAALRWKTQLNENSKMFAIHNVFPELNHNETVGWALAGQPERVLVVVVLRDWEDPPRLVQRLEITREIAFHRAGGYHEVWSRGDGPLSRLTSLVLFGDLVSVYLAYLNDVDPYPVVVIDELKRRLEAGPR
ncbi:MAG: bifunctional phosphoglucose/phosphomannose isomerase [Armatimonadota bacterium]|nr:bifunctional phosphoglucose/phosphomannose isomerase [Armatimonadota bacterium]MDR7562163.1 bifunctional phosphoglucose/phosphomannose isomerase [Armatimonadota bacterium]MDR7567110.1 bifunctional phosphoglucose/phosphomannose isomerase [Armatimonadota bacterium]